MQFSWQASGLILLGIITPTTIQKIHFKRRGIGKSTYNNVHYYTIGQITASLLSMVSWMAVADRMEGPDQGIDTYQNGA
jgi:hypothetical protein